MLHNMLHACWSACCSLNKKRQSEGRLLTSPEQFAERSSSPFYLKSFRMHDLNIRLKSSKEKDLKAAVKRLFELGWDCVAWTTLANGKILGNLTKPVKSVMLEPIQRRDALELRSLVTGSTSITDIRQMSRITVTIDDVIDAQSLTVGNSILNSFDIVAARPGNMKVMAYLCKTAEIDIITLDFTHRLPFAINKKLLDEAVKRGIFIEIIHSPIIGTVSGARQEVFSNTRILIQYLRGKNIILSSGADTIGQLRGPMDVCNIGIALGLNVEKAMNAVANNCAMVLKHALARKNRFLPIEVISRSDFKLKYPEANLDDSQSSKHNVPLEFAESVLSSDSTMKIDINNGEEDEEDDEEDDDEIDNKDNKSNNAAFVRSAISMLTEITNFETGAGAEEEGEEAEEREEVQEEQEEEGDEEDVVGFEVSLSGDILTFEINADDENGNNGGGMVEDDREEVDEEVEEVEEHRVEGREEEQEGEQEGEDENSFDLGDSFISFSSTTASSSSKRGRESGKESRGTDSDMIDALKPLNPELKISANSTKKKQKTPQLTFKKNANTSFLTNKLKKTVTKKRK